MPCTAARPTSPARLSTCSWLALVLLCSLAFALPARAQIPAPAPEAATNPATAIAEVVARDSPRASMADFLALCRANQYAHAARYLELPQSEEQRGPVLAARLKAVLDREAWVDVEKLSPLATGDLEDDLPRAND